MALNCPCQPHRNTGRTRSTSETTRREEQMGMRPNRTRSARLRVQHGLIEIGVRGLQELDVFLERF